MYFRTVEALASSSARARCLFIHVGDWRSTADQAAIVRDAQLLVEEMVNESWAVSTPEACYTPQLA